MTTTQWERLWSDFRESAKTNPAQLYRRELIHKHLAIPRCSKSVETNAPNQNEVKILDAGSGPGDLLAELNERYPQAGLLGLELSATGIDYAKRIAPHAEYRQTDLCIPHPIPKAFLGWATHGICSEVLEHVDHPLVFLQQLLRYLQRGGKLVVTVPSGPMTAF